METHSTRALVSIIVQSAQGGNKNLFNRAIIALQEKTLQEREQGLYSIVFHLREHEIGPYFTSRIEEITPKEEPQPAV